MGLCRYPEDTCHFDLLTLCYLKLQILLGVAHVASDSRSTLISFRVGCVNDSGSEQLTTKLLQQHFGIQGFSPLWHTQAADVIW